MQLTLEQLAALNITPLSIPTGPLPGALGQVQITPNDIDARLAAQLAHAAAFRAHMTKFSDTTTDEGRRIVFELRTDTR